MGFFSKLKQNFKHGGVKVTMQAPASVSMQEADLTVTVTVTATDSEAQVNSVRVDMYSESRTQSFNGGGASVSPTTTLVARAENTEQFTLAPGQSTSIPLNIIMNVGAAIQTQLPDSVAGQVLGAVQKLQAVGEALQPNSNTYYLQAQADVAGIALDPSSVRHPIQVLKPGQISITNIG